MDPLSAWTFCRRHKRHAVLLVGLIGLVTVGLYLMVALSWAIFVEPMRSNYAFLSRFSMVLAGYEGLDAVVIARIRANPDVARVIPVSGAQIGLPEVMGGGADWFYLFAVKEEDVSYLMEKCGATVKEGQGVQARTNGIMLSEQVAASLGLQVGDTIQDSINPELYGNIVDPIQVVGILESEVRLGIASYEYWDSHELYRRFPIQFLVVPREGRAGVVEAFMQSEIQAAGAAVLTHQWLAESMASEYRATLSLLVPIILTVAIVMTLVVGIANQITFARRLPEFGILHTAGYGKRWLARRLTIEAGCLALIGWMAGIGLSWLLLYLLKWVVFVPRGHDLDVMTLGPALLAVPIPVSVTGFTLVSMGRVFSRLDAVAVIERAELSLEQNRRRAVTASTSTSRPLSAATFYRRHKRRAVLMIGAMAMMIVSVVLVVFLLVATHDAERAGLGNLSRMSMVGSRPGSSLGPAITTLVRTHPAVERVILTSPRYYMLSLFIPPFGESGNASPYGVSAEDMAYLVELYGLRLKDGHLPRPRTNEMVIPEALAQNRGLKVGDVVGSPDRPAYPGAPDLPAEFVISGIFARPAVPGEENWLSFVSLEFLSSHEGFGILDDVTRLIVVPKAGQKAALDDWLENELAGDEVWILTYRQETIRAQERTRSLILAMVLIESVIAAVAATALAAIDYISISQRQPEFGILHALGHGRSRLVRYAIGETALTTAAAWCLSATICLLGLLYLQFGLFTPLGLRLSVLDPMPWLFTLPIPVTVLAVTIATVGLSLHKLDPVAVIERRNTAM